MLQIILFILKIIGIILLIVLGILILALLAVLFIPVRYRIHAKYPDRPYVMMRISWFLHLIRCRIIYDKDLDISAKILFFNLYGQESKKKMKKQVKKAENTIFDDMEEEGIKDYSKKNDTVSEWENQSHKHENTVSEKQIHSSESLSASTAKDRLVKNISDSKEKLKSVQTENEFESVEKTEKENIKNDELLLPEVKLKKNKPTFFKWLKWICRKAFVKIKHFYHALKELVLGVVHKTAGAKEAAVNKINSVLETVNDPENRELVAFIWSQVKILLKKIKPNKYKIRIRFGFEDPETTGKVAMYAAFVYGILGLSMDITPEFEQEILDGEVYLKGKVRIISLLIIAIRVYTNRLVKKIIRKSGKK